MSASQRRTPPEPSGISDKQQTTITALYRAEEQDLVEWDGRVNSLEVIDEGFTDSNKRYIVAQGPRGGQYPIEEQYNDDGEPIFRSKGNAINGLTIVDKAGGADEATEEPSTETVDDDGGVADDLDTTEDNVERDVGQRFPTDEMPVDDENGGDPTMPSNDAEPVSADEYVEQFDDDVLIGDDYDSWLEQLGKEHDIGDSSFFGGGGPEHSHTHTFVDELVAFGVDVPKSVNNWHLVDYGLVRNGVTRKIGYYNRQAGRVIVLFAVNTMDGTEWAVYEADADADGDVEPDMVTMDPWAAIDELHDRLGVSGAPDIEYVEDGDGEVVVKDDIEPGQMARNVVASIGGALPNVQIGGRTGAALGILEQSGSEAADWFDRNTQRVVRYLKGALLYSLSVVPSNLTNVRISPVLIQEDTPKSAIGVGGNEEAVPGGDEVIEGPALGLQVHYKYSNDYSSGQVVVPGGTFTVDPADLPFFETRTEFQPAQGGVEGSGEDAQYVHPTEAGEFVEVHQIQFSFMAVTFEQLVDAGEIVGLRNLSFALPGSERIEGLAQEYRENESFGLGAPSSWSDSSRSTSRSRSAPTRDQSEALDKIAQETQDAEDQAEKIERLAGLDARSRAEHDERLRTLGYDPDEVIESVAQDATDWLEEKRDVDIPSDGVDDLAQVEGVQSNDIISAIGQIRREWMEDNFPSAVDLGDDDVKGLIDPEYVVEAMENGNEVPGVDGDESDGDGISMDERPVSTLSVTPEQTTLSDASYRQLDNLQLIVDQEGIGGLGEDDREVYESLRARAMEDKDQAGGAEEAAVARAGRESVTQAITSGVEGPGQVDDPNPVGDYNEMWSSPNSPEAEQQDPAADDTL